MERPSPAAMTMSPILLGVLALLLVLAVVGARGRRPAGTRVYLAGAVLAAVVAMVSPVATLGAHYSLTAHLVQCTVVMGVVPPLLLIGLRGLHLGVPVAARGFLACLVHPAVAIVLVNVVFFGWHATALYGACLEHEELYSTQMATLLAVSVAFWWPIVEPDGRSRLGAFWKLGYILLATIPQTFAGMMFALSIHPFYDAYAAAPRTLGMTAMADQQIAGACMALLSKLALFAAFSIVFLRLFSESEIEGGAGDDGWRGDDGRHPGPLPSPAPDWFGLLERGVTVDDAALEDATPAVRRRYAGVQTLERR